jgi:cytochrome bd ubiquinol oxidase subunit II
MGIDLPLIWALIIGFGLMMYVIMDGFDLGVGILFPFVQDRDDRDTMVNTVAPVWDGNETWLVLGAAALLAAFPTAYAVILSALYLPLLLMLGGLIWRGVAFEFRFKADDAHKPFWDKAFASGSYIATMSQGVALGTFINGFNVTNDAYSDGGLDWLTPFSLFHRRRACCRLCPARLDLADHEDRRPVAAPHERVRAAGDDRFAGADCRRQSLDAAVTSGHR